MLVTSSALITNQKGIDYMVKYSTETEVWKDVVGFEKYYSVSDSGYVYSKRKKLL